MSRRNRYCAIQKEVSALTEDAGPKYIQMPASEATMGDAGPSTEPVDNKEKAELNMSPPEGRMSDVQYRSARGGFSSGLDCSAA